MTESVQPENKKVASNPHGTAEAELELYTGIMVATGAGSDGISTPADPDSNDALSPGNGGVLFSLWHSGYQCR